MLSRYLVIPDIHWPKHDPEALACVLAVARYFRPHETILLGDGLECDQFSTHPGKTLSEDKTRSWVADMDSFAEGVLDPLTRASSKRLVMLEGNHEFRVERAAVGSPAIRSVMDVISPRAIFGKRKRFLWVPYQEPVMGHYEITPRLWCVHGWSEAEHAATAHLSRCSSFSVIHGHTHRRQEDSKRDPATDNVLLATSAGFLGKLQPVWRGADPTKWSHGFHTVYADHDADEFWINTHQIDRGVTLVNGRRISA